MKSLKLNVRIFSLSIALIVAISGFVINPIKKSELIVTSSDLKNESVEFTLTYQQNDEGGKSETITVVKTTPFKMNIEKDYFSGSITPKNNTNNVKVEINLFNGNEISASASGTFHSTHFEVSPGRVSVSKATK